MVERSNKVFTVSLTHPYTLTHTPSHLHTLSHTLTCTPSHPHPHSECPTLKRSMSYLATLRTHFSSGERSLIFDSMSLSLHFVHSKLTCETAVCSIVVPLLRDHLQIQCNLVPKRRWASKGGFIVCTVRASVQGFSGL